MFSVVSGHRSPNSSAMTCTGSRYTVRRSARKQDSMRFHSFIRFSLFLFVFRRWFVRLLIELSHFLFCNKIRHILQNLEQLPICRIEIEPFD